MANEQNFLYLTTIGWQSGNPHEIEIWYVEHDGCYYLVAERGERSHWVQNIHHNPAITFRVGDRHFAGTARLLDNQAEPHLAQAVSAAMDQKYGWSAGLIVELKP
jgi:deazaflavin-dependent oxidoreductase (nitroreductase family)